VLVCVATVLFAVPQQINYQGKITNSSGVGLDGTYSMTFRIYNVATGGTALWSETHSSVGIHRGLFDVVLGETNPINLPFDEQYYLEIEVGGEVLTPRIPLSSVGYAFRASIADSVAGGAGQVLTLSFGSDDTLRLTQSVGSSFAVNIPVKEDDLSDNSIGDLGDVNTSGVSAGQVLKWDGSAWVPANDSVGAGSGSDNDWTGAGTGSMYATYTSDNVGIGTTSPSAKLDVAGNVHIQNELIIDINNKGWGFRTPFGSSSEINFRPSSGSGNFQVGSSSGRNGVITFGGAYWYDAVGVSGDPTPPPYDAGSVYGMYPTSSGIRWYDGSSWQTITPGGGGVGGSGSANYLAIWSDASNLTYSSQLYWDAGNNRLGINTTSPDRKLTIYQGDIHLDDGVGTGRAIYFGDGSFVYVGERSGYDDDLLLYCSGDPAWLDALRFVPVSDNSTDLGSSANSWKDLYIDGGI